MKLINTAIKKVFALLGYKICKMPTDSSVRENLKTNSTSLTMSVEDLNKFVNRNEVIKLHVGCGPRVLKGWINIDLVYEYYGKGNYLDSYTDTYYPPEIRGNQKDVFEMDVRNSNLPFNDGSVDVIFHEDFIEHLNQRDQFCFLAETLRILKPGGIHRVNTPDISYWMKKMSDFKKGRDGIDTNIWDRW